MIYSENIVWIDKSTKQKNVITFRAADRNLHEEFKNNKDSENYVPGIEYEPYVLYIIQGGFRDYYHVIIESGEDGYSKHEEMTQEQIESTFNVKI